MFIACPIAPLKHKLHESQYFDYFLVCLLLNVLNGCSMSVGFHAPPTLCMAFVLKSDSWEEPFRAAHSQVCFSLP